MDLSATRKAANQRTLNFRVLLLADFPCVVDHPPIPAINSMMLEWNRLRSPHVNVIALRHIAPPIGRTGE